MLALFLSNFLRFVVIALWVLVLARVLLSYVDPASRGTIARFVYQLTEPLLAPVRKLLPRTGPLDFSSFIVLIVLGVILRAVG